MWRAQPALRHESGGSVGRAVPDRARWLVTAGIARPTGWVPGSHGRLGYARHQLWLAGRAPVTYSWPTSSGIITSPFPQLSA